MISVAPSAIAANLLRDVERSTLPSGLLFHASLKKGITYWSFLWESNIFQMCIWRSKMILQSSFVTVFNFWIECQWIKYMVHFYFAGNHCSFLENFDKFSGLFTIQGTDFQCTLQAFSFLAQLHTFTACKGHETAFTSSRLVRVKRSSALFSISSLCSRKRGN